MHSTSQKNSQSSKISCVQYDTKTATELDVGNKEEQILYDVMVCPAFKFPRFVLI